MNSNELRKKFLKFFEKRGHGTVPSSSLIPLDSTVLFTTAGMQQFKPHYMGEKSPYGKRVCSCQKCFRTSDIEEVGDEKHLTFLEMLGNFSFGDYFKEEAIELAYELLNSKFQIPKSKMTVTVFSGDKDVPRDEESARIWSKFGFFEKNVNLRFCGREDNFWGPTGEEGPCGPTTEIHFNDMEVWNLVFNEYYQDRNKNLTPLKQKGVDTGMGLERLAMVCQGKPSVYETDLFLPIMKDTPSQNEKAKRIIADHIKSSVFLISEGILPSNVERGYVLRRILRRAIRYGRLLNLSKNFLIPLGQKVVEIYKDVYPEVKSQETDILTVIQNEEEKFEKSLEKGLKEYYNIFNWWDKKVASLDEIKQGGQLNYFSQEETKEIGKKFFDLFQNYGFPLEQSLEEMKNYFKREDVFKDEIIKYFQEELKKHQEISRAGAEKKFGGGGEFSPKLHTATHLLHVALREVLGEHVKQMGSDITSQRLRFDFSHSQKLTAEEIKKVEDLVNEKIKEDLAINKEEMEYKEAIKCGALAFFKEKYPERVTVFTIGDFSKEICAGPHANRTSELGRFRIIKEESSGAGVRRIRAILK
ncbi:MAG: alanine--tRNA ligase [Candidatus Nealsonbacteria bacterium CG10_big_fil_rev_8_21_14_0_10_36_23]|uniref:alanine--tRNA ligase n=1 Tax=Candidatus Nealsonbacteria bacterium CG10_big_fil_rev_8_21_14_0_10_36_23 TaxID=1974709 RepID=A0A2H0TL61_9BACT|nr:MAG: alanine--tRNA ligase [Candidatus Nealsonbacteria bacterium CG10_big_fil_rev_8_21_14_0_10_36_23]